jgi:hypothetical protein
VLSALSAMLDFQGQKYSTHQPRHETRRPPDQAYFNAMVEQDREDDDDGDHCGHCIETGAFHLSAFHGEH